MLAIVVFIFWRLHSVLGMGGGRTPKTKGPKVKGSGAENNGKSKKAQNAKIASKRPNLRLVDKDTKQPQRGGAQRGGTQRVGDQTVWAIGAETNLPAHVRKGLEAIAAKDKQFNISSFLKGAAQAYQIILLAYASHDRAQLKPLLSQEVFDGFDTAMQAREVAGHKLETNILKLAPPTIHDAELDGRFARITARIEAELTSIMRDADANQLAGTPETSEKTVDLWTFERAIDSKSPNWLLVATETI
ncbi:MAG: Tim44/TimA family putative adaptor protein [Alphaproteobacteria bacterium]|nr:Tim44/TimA family putative adaptor protein [Alphaproteobacteria bacterium]